jgi:hypothetical protein
VISDVNFTLFSINSLQLGIKAKTRGATEELSQNITSNKNFSTFNRFLQTVYQTIQLNKYMNKIASKIYKFHNREASKEFSQKVVPYTTF